uniref:Uncharacterized protein n=1 Tax=viral metagenome TaxID=1070528 RepID=A0A6C0BMG4_9ZZZZ
MPHNKTPTPRGMELPPGLSFGGQAPAPVIKPKPMDAVKKYGKFVLLGVVVLVVGYLYYKRRKAKKAGGGGGGGLAKILGAGGQHSSVPPAAPVPAPAPHQPEQTRVTAPPARPAQASAAPRAAPAPTGDPNFTPL